MQFGLARLRFDRYKRFREGEDTYMSMGFTYWAELTPMKLSAEGTMQQWVHALPVGTYEHPVYGKLEFSAERIERFVKNIKAKVRGVDPDIDYDHKERDGKAAGWVKDAEARGDGLWLFVEWTNTAAKSIGEKEYRYFSSEFVDEWTDPETGKTYTDVLLGGAVTNRPFMKNLVPLNLNELVGLSDKKKENVMDRAELIKLLGLKEDATDDDIKNALAARNKIDLSKAEVTVGEDGTIKVTHPDAEGEIVHEAPAREEEEQEQEGSEEEEAELAKLAESNPLVAKVLNDHKALKSDVAQLTAAQRLSEVSTQLSELGSAQKRSIPPVAQAKLRDLMVKLPKKFSDDLHEALVELVKVGIVELGESTGKRRSGEQTDGEYDAVKKFMDKVDEAMAADKELTYRVAVAKVARDEPQLFADYNEAVTANQMVGE